MSAVCLYTFPLTRSADVCDNQYRLFRLAIKYGSESVPLPEGCPDVGATGATSFTVTTTVAGLEPAFDATVRWKLVAMRVPRARGGMVAEINGHKTHASLH